MNNEFTTTFWTDFTIADAFGKSAVKDTFNRAFEEWKSDYRYLTDLVMVLNHKIWEHYEKGSPLAEVYNGLWEKADSYAMDHLKDEEMAYFLRVTD